MVTRLGGDEFAVLVMNADEDQDVAALAAELAHAVQSPVLIDELTLHVRASIGIAFVPDHGDSAHTLLRRADVAMYAAKSSGTEIATYSADDDRYSRRRLSLVGDLRRALQEGALELYFQPQVRFDTGEIDGVEALLRWAHPAFGFVPPDEFIPVAEQAGLIADLTRWVLRTAIAQQVEWSQLGLDVRMAVNLSARNLHDARLVDDLRSYLVDAGLSPARLTLELTETSIMADANRGITMLQALSALGVRISIDDFGTGHSSLSRLSRMPVHEIKVDRSFVMGMTRDPSNEVIARTTVDLGLNLGLQVIAEGVEDNATWDLLHALGCHAAQGYLFTPPLPAAALQAWFASAPPPLRRVRELAAAPSN
jgi:predicted signal transduction protein with EAL and GGDEF domain